MESKEIDIIIPHYADNPDKDLLLCLDSIDKCRTDDVEVIIVINGHNPSHTLLDCLGNSYKYAKVIVIPTRITSYKARMIGVANSFSPIVSFIDSDVCVDASFFKQLHKDFSDPATMMSGGRVEFTGESKVSFITANLAVRRSVFEKVSFNTHLFSGGDLDFAHRVIMSGFNAEYSYNRIVYHKPENYQVRFSKSLRYGSGTSTQKIMKSWVKLFKDAGLLFAKSIGFFYYIVTKKPLGKL